MKVCIRRTLTTTCLALFFLAGQASALDGWTQDIDEAMEKAKAEKKDLLLNFTGSDWCVWCKKLEGEVFGKEEFVKEAQKQFVMVTLDFPQDKANVPVEIQKQNATWKQKFGVSGFPTVYLTNAEGRPYAKTGYQPGGPEAYLPHLKEKRAVSVKLAEKLAEAKQAKGIDRAKLLDEALLLLDEDLVETHYADVVKEIVSLDSKNEAGLRGKWNAARDEEERREVLARISFVKRTQPPKVVLGIVNKALAQYRFPIETKVEVMEVKLKMLNATGGQAEAVALLEELIADQRIDESSRERLRVQLIYSLVHSGKQQEALSLLDDLAVQYKDRRHRFLFSKGELLDRLGRHDEALASYDLAIGASADSDFRHEVQLAKSDSLTSLEKFDAAVALLDEILQNKQTSYYLLSDTYLQKAMILRDADRIADAEQAEQQAIEKAETAQQRAAVEKLIEQLRRQSNK